MFHKSRLIEDLSIEGFRQLWERIQDVAINEFRFLPEDTQPVR